MINLNTLKRGGNEMLFIGTLFSCFLLVVLFAVSHKHKENKNANVIDFTSVVFSDKK